MLEEGGATNMDKKTSRQSSVPPKNGASCDSKKNDNNSPNRFAKYGKKRESAGARGGTPDYARRPAPQKSRTTGDKRPRSRGYNNDRQREEVAGREDPDYGSPCFTGGSKKANLNHLLNFTFASRESQRGGSSSYRGGGGRKPRTFGRVYNKERFLQANCQFVVREESDYTAHSIDADTLVDWDLIQQVRTVSHETPTCPICLQEPLAGKITRCGHIYCWACILHYLELEEHKWRKCPICYDSIQKSDLKSVEIRVVHAYQPGEKITMRLMKRERGSTYSVPNNQWEKRDGKPHQINDAVNTEFTKLLVASVAQIQDTIIDREKSALQKHLETAEDSEVCFIDTALALLKEREEMLHTRNAAERIQAAVEKVEKKCPEDVKQRYTTEINKRDLNTSSSFSEKEESDAENQTGDTELLPESPVPDLDLPTLSLEPQSSDLDSESPSSPTFTQTESDSAADTSGNRYSTSSETDVLLDGNTDVSRERSSMSESSTGSVEGPGCECPIQQSMNDALPVEEAAEHLELPAETVTKTNKTKSAFYYYQASDGQHIYLHALNARCLVKEHGCLEDGPDTITATIIDTERIFMTEELRKRLRYLGHLPLTCEFQVAELALKPPVVSKETLTAFAGDIEKRRRMRQRKAREDKKRSKKIEEEENAKIGKFPEMRISLSSSVQFPSYDEMTSPTQSLYVSTDVRPESPSVSSLASSPPVSPSEVGEMGAAAGRSRDNSDGEQTSMSFAQMLKAGKTKTQPVWPRPVETTAAPTLVKCADSEESDNEDRVPVPMFQDSFSSAIQAALDTVNKDKESRPSGGGKKKKQKQKFTKLFDTSMTRGK